MVGVLSNLRGGSLVGIRHYNVNSKQTYEYSSQFSGNIWYNFVRKIIQVQFLLTCFCWKNSKCIFVFIFEVPTFVLFLSENAEEKTECVQSCALFVLVIHQLRREGKHLLWIFFENNTVVTFLFMPPQCSECGGIYFGIVMRNNHLNPQTTL